MSKHYPLEQLVIIKQKKLEEAERSLQEKKLALKKEEEKLTQVENERNKIKDHKTAKLTQLRKELDQGTTTTKIQQMKLYMKEVDEKLKQKELKVKDQKKQVDAATTKVEEARKELLKKQQDVEKLSIHRKEWEKEVKTQEEYQESLEGDEMGSSMYVRRKEKAAKEYKRKQQEK